MSLLLGRERVGGMGVMVRAALQGKRHCCEQSNDQSSDQAKLELILTLTE